MSFHVPDGYRIRHGSMASNTEYGNNGAFEIPRTSHSHYVAIASDGMGWEHVSARLVDNGKNKIPAWEDMCRIKDIFWDEEDVVM